MNSVTSLAKNSLIKDLRKIKAIKYLHSHTDADIFLIGGSVRDLLLNLPNKDIDMVITKIPITKLIKVLKPFGKVDIVGKRFGVLKFSPNNSKFKDIDIALPRTETSINFEGNRSDFIVKPNKTIDIKKDLKRRDFTINSIAYNIKTNQIVDEFDGLTDIKNKLLKCTGNPKTRFTEDYSRMLRAIRFSCQLGFKIEEQTFKTIKKLANKIKNKKSISREIIASELLKAFFYNTPKALDLLYKTGLLKNVFSNIENNKKTELLLNQIISLCKKEQKNFLEPENYLNLVLSILFLFHNKFNFKKTTKTVLKLYNELKLSSPKEYKTKVKDTIFICKNLEFINNTEIKDIKLTTLEKIFVTNTQGYGLKTILNILSKTNFPELKIKYKKLNIRLNIIKKNNTKILFTGEELYTKFDIKKGPYTGKLLSELRELQLQGKLKTKKDAIKYLASKNYEHKN